MCSLSIVVIKNLYIQTSLMVALGKRGGEGPPIYKSEVDITLLDTLATADNLASPHKICIALASLTPGLAVRARCTTFLACPYSRPWRASTSSFGRWPGTSSEAQTPWACASRTTLRPWHAWAALLNCKHSPDRLPHHPHFATLPLVRGAYEGHLGSTGRPSSSARLISFLQTFNTVSYSCFSASKSLNPENCCK